MVRKIMGGCLYQATPLVHLTSGAYLQWQELSEVLIQGAFLAQPGDAKDWIHNLLRAQWKKKQL